MAGYPEAFRDWKNDLDTSDRNRMDAVLVGSKIIGDMIVGLFLQLEEEDMTSELSGLLRGVRHSQGPVQQGVSIVRACLAENYDEEIDLVLNEIEATHRAFIVELLGQLDIPERTMLSVSI